MNPRTKPLAVIPDANVIISLCAREKDTYSTAKTAVDDYINKGYEFFAPEVIVAEVVFVLCHKLTAGELTQLTYQIAIETFKDYMSFISAAPNGETSLIDRSIEIRSGYGCSRSSDGLYIALAEELSNTYEIEILTFDKGMVNQTAKNAPTVAINLLSI
jgi:predicted nucleic acid-binding protein